MKHCWLILLLGISSLLHAQTGSEDSLLYNIDKIPDDTDKVKLFYSLGQTYAYSQLDTALFYYRRAYALSRKLHYNWGEVKFYAYASSVLNAKGEFDKSLALNKEGLRKCQSLPYPKLLPNQYINIGNGFQFLDNYDSSIYYYLQAQAVYEQRNDSNGLAFVYGNMAEVYAMQHRKEDALKYARWSIQYWGSSPHNHAYCNFLYNLANDEYDMKLYSDALAHYKEVEKLCRETSDDYLLSLVLNSYFGYYERTGEHRNLYGIADEYLKLVEPMGSDLFLSNAYYMKAAAFFYNKQFGEAEKYVLKAISTPSNEQVLKHAYSLASDIMLVEHKDIKAYGRYTNLADSIQQVLMDADMLKNAQDLEKRYETQKKEQQLLLQNKDIIQKKLWILVLVISLVALVLMLFLSVRIYRNRQQLQQQKIAKLESEKQLSATQAVLKGQDEERSRLAKDLHDGLGSMLSGVKFSFAHLKQNMVMTAEMHYTFERGLDMLDKSIKELRSVAHNMMPEVLLKLGLDAALEDLCVQARQSGVKVVYQSMGLGYALPQETALNVYRVVQELVTNALKHAEATEILVQLSILGNTLSVTVEDNGKGFDVLHPGVGLGWSSIRNRIMAVQGTLDVKSGLGNGTSVFIQIPIKS